MFRTPLPERTVLGFTVVNYSFRAVSAVFFMSLLLAGCCVVTAVGFADLHAGAGLITWLALTPAVFALMMKVRDGAVRREIEEGRHDPVWGNHIRRQSQRETDALFERNPLTRPLFRLACQLGIHKKQ